jgi:hypothetical protein
VVHGASLGALFSGHAALLEAAARGSAGAFPPPAPRLRTNAATGVAVFQTYPHPTGLHAASAGLPGSTVEVHAVAAAASAEDTEAAPAQSAAYAAAHAGAPAAAACCVVLGAGNVAFLAVHDMLHKLFIENIPVVLKWHEAQVRGGY